MSRWIGACFKCGSRVGVKEYSNGTWCKTHAPKERMRYLIEKAGRQAKPVFDKFGYTYRDEPLPPTEKQLRSTVRHLIKNLLRDENERYDSSSTGRFEVRREVDEEGMYTIRVALELDYLYLTPPEYQELVNDVVQRPPKSQVKVGKSAKESNRKESLR